MQLYLIFSKYKVGYDQSKQTLYIIDDGVCYSYYPVTNYAYSQIASGSTTMLQVVMSSIVPELAATPKVSWIEISDGVDMYEVNSSTIKAVGYDKSNSVLYVEYIDGGLYAYYNVPLNYWNGLEQADSKGSWVHFWLKINDNEFPYRKVNNADLVYNGIPTPNPGSPHPDGYLTGFEKQK